MWLWGLLIGWVVASLVSVLVLHTVKSWCTAQSRRTLEQRTSRAAHPSTGRVVGGPSARPWAPPVLARSDGMSGELPRPPFG